MSTLSVTAGQAHPLGATVVPGGVNFSLFSRHADAVELLLFDASDSPAPAQVIPLDPRIHKSFHFWHVFVEGLRPGAHYAYRVDGPWKPERPTASTPRRCSSTPTPRATRRRCGAGGMPWVPATTSPRPCAAS